MGNPNRGEIAGKIGDLDINLSPTFGRISRAEAAVNKSCFDIIAGYQEGGRSMKLGEIAVFLSQVSKPRIDHNEIGKHLMGKGYKQAMELVMKIVAVVIDDGDDDDYDPDAIPDPDDDEDDLGN